MVNSMQTLKYLKKVTYSNFYNWSVQYLLESNHSYNEKYNFVKIGSFLKRNKTSIDIADGIEYKRVTIKINNNGVFLRDIEKGENIGTKKQFTIKKGQFLLSKIDARNGAFGVVPEVVDNGIITGNFWTYDVDYSLINPYFLALITTTPEFIKFSENASNGTTNRHYLQEGLFLDQNIPLPSLEEQNRIIDSYNTKLQLAEEQELEAKRLEESIEKYLFEELGVEIRKDGLRKKFGEFIKIFNYSEFDKWGANQNNSNKLTLTKPHQICKISDICTVSSGGTPSRDRKEYYTGNIPWIKTGEVINDVIFDTEEKITEEAIKNSSARIYPKDSLIIAMYGQGLTRGRTAKLGVNASTNQACAVLFNINKSIVLIDYLWIYLIGEYDRMRELASGNNQPNLNAQMIKDYSVIIPAVEVQKVIIKNINSIKLKIKELKDKSLKNKEEAIIEFEKEIFN
jgi:type I restriction enzyme S subunit